LAGVGKASAGPANLGRCLNNPFLRLDPKAMSFFVLFVLSVVSSLFAFLAFLAAKFRQHTSVECNEVHLHLFCVALQDGWMGVPHLCSARSQSW